MEACERTLSFRHFRTEPVLILQDIGGEALLLHPDTTLTRAMRPTEVIRTGSHIAVTEIMKQALLLPKEIPVYLEQCTRVMRDLRLSGFSEDKQIEETLRVRLLPVILTMESLNRVYLSSYVQELAPLLVSYLSSLTPASSRLLSCWEDIAATLNHISQRVLSSDETMRDVLNSAMEAGLPETLLGIAAWVDVKLLVSLKLDLMKEEFARRELCGRLCETLLGRVNQSEHVFALLEIALSFALTSELKSRVVEESLTRLRPSFQSFLTLSQRSLISALTLHACALIASSDIPLGVLFSDKTTEPAGRRLVIEQIVAGVKRYEDFKLEIKEEALVSCFNKDTVKSVILARNWECLASVRNITDVLASYLRLLLEQDAPESLLEFTSLAVSTAEIAAAAITSQRKEAVVDSCLLRRQWPKAEYKEINAKVGLIRLQAQIFRLLFAKKHTFLRRVPNAVVRLVAFEYLHRTDIA